MAAGAAKVICLEPSGLMVECLQRTFKAEIAAGRVELVQAAAGALEGVTHFQFDSQLPFGGKTQKDAPGQPVRVATLAGLCEELNLPRVDFIKMDIEGAETQAVEGALTLLSQHAPRLAITTYHRAFDYAVLHSLLVAAGYKNFLPAGLTSRGGDAFRPVMIHAWP